MLHQQQHHKAQQHHGTIIQLLEFVLILVMKVIIIQKTVEQVVYQIQILVTHFLKMLQQGHKHGMEQVGELVL
jgi:hypothetical protein